MWLYRQYIWKIISVIVLYRYHCDGEIIQVNVAVGKTANQSGTLRYLDVNHHPYTGPPWNASTAVDGNKSCTSVNSVFYSGTEDRSRPWWQVDLGNVYNINKIYVYGKDNAAHEKQYDGFRVYVNNNKSTSENQVRHHYVRNTNVKYDVVYGPMFGRYVTIDLPPSAPGKLYKPLVLCEVEVYVDNLFSRISVATLMSPAWEKHNASLAVDGIEPTPSNNFRKCSCCSVALSDTPTWWQVNLQAKYLIGAVYISGRSVAHQDQTKDFSVVASNTTYGNGNGGEIVYRIPDYVTAHAFVNTIHPPRLLQYLQIIRNDLLTICEVKLVQSECEIGTFGDGCLRHCHCDDGNQCNQSTGHCQTPGCAVGWNGTSCENKCSGGAFGRNCAYQSRCSHGSWNNPESGICNSGECEPGWKNLNCSILCEIGAFGDGCIRHCHCDDGNQCNQSTGHCQTPGCAVGWNGTSCENKCSGGAFGRNCAYQSHCSHGSWNNPESGICNSGECEPGWKNLNCSIPCTDGTFGSGCIYKSFCINDSKNEPAHGVCSVGICEPGWQLNNCSIRCDKGTFGLNCSGFCHCASGADCRNDNGSCPDTSSRCKAGWQGVACDKLCPNGTFWNDCIYTSHCINESKNDPADGTCEKGACDPGWQLQNCSIGCSHRRFGMSCLDYCHCNNDADCVKADGKCPLTSPRCDAAWYGTSCNKVCPNGTFWNDCIYTSHCINESKNDPADGTCETGACDAGWQLQNCSIVYRPRSVDNNDADCVKTDGECPSMSPRCDASWNGTSCDKACPDGTFGKECLQRCHCKADLPCNKSTGFCESGCLPGWNGSSCSQACPDGTFGKECLQRCHCKADLPCNKSTGFCESGCLPGWTSSSCSQACPDGKFGYDCVHSCRCLNNATCDKVLGNCSNGCDYGRSGFDCRTDHNLLSVIKNNVRTSMSSNSPGHGPTLAVGGSYDSMSPNLEACDCCSATMGTEKPWWQIDIGRQILIQEMYIIGSQRDVRSQSENLLCDISNTSVVDEAGGTLLENGSHTGTVYHYSYRFPKLFQYLIVRQSLQTVMIVCEVKLIEGDCSNGTFGDGCGRSCHCLDRQPCDKTLGRCQSPECLPGWKGMACDQVCPSGSHGLKCKHKCGTCVQNEICDTVTGLCQHGCAPGFTGIYCTDSKSNDATGNSDNNSLIAPIAGGLSALLALFLAIIIALLILYLRTKAKARQEQTPGQDDENQTTENTYERPDMNMAASSANTYDSLEAPDTYEMVETAMDVKTYYENT